jgi:hypothetical protein
MSKLKKIVIAVASLLGVLGFAGVVLANPSYFGVGVTTGTTASSTPAFMTPGTATSTTPVYDAYAPAAGTQHWKANQASLAIQFTASSTATVYSASIEYSNDGIDWYRNYVLDSNALGTTTTPYNLVTPESISYKFASSTVGGLAQPANGNLSTAYLIIPTLARYTRVVFSVTGGNGAVWAQLVPIKEAF